MAVYYNEIDPFAAAWLRSLIAAGHIPDGDVDERSIANVQPMDLKDYAQCHFFAGIGGWSHALRLAGWPDDRPIWTGSCPCQPFSVAGKGKGKSDERHLWPVFHQLIAQCRPPVVMGEQVAGKAGYDWFDGVAADLEAEGYASRAVDVPACAVDAPHIRQRLYWCAVDDAVRGRHRDADREIFTGRDGAVDASGVLRDMADAEYARPPFTGREPQSEGAQHRPLDARREERCFWDDTEWLTGADGKTRRAKPGVRLLAHGLPNRVGRLRGYGNAIVPPLAAEVVKAFMDA